MHPDDVGSPSGAMASEVVPSVSTISARSGYQYLSPERRTSYVRGVTEIGERPGRDRIGCRDLGSAGRLGRGSLYADDRLTRCTSAASATVSMSGSSLSSMGAAGARRPEVHNVHQVCHVDPPSICFLQGAGILRRRAGRAGCGQTGGRRRGGPAVGTGDAAGEAEAAAIHLTTGCRLGPERAGTGAASRGRFDMCLDLDDQADLTNPLQRNSSPPMARCAAPPDRRRRCRFSSMASLYLPEVSCQRTSGVLVSGLMLMVPHSAALAESLAEVRSRP